MAEEIFPLSNLAPGKSGVVVELRVPVESQARLLEMGLLAGTPIDMIRYAPLGDPVEIKIRGYHLSIRRHEADLILVRPS